MADASGVVTAAPGPWPSCLDALGAHLAQQQEALQAGRLDEIRAFPVPAGLPPLPAELAAAAAQLLAQSEALEHAVRVAQEDVRRQLRLARRMAVPPPAAASFIERHA